MPRVPSKTSPRPQKGKVFRLHQPCLPHQSFLLACRSEEDSRYTYCMADIDALSDELGIPWEKSKDIPFSTTVPFIGFLWDLDARTVSISDSRKEKYLQAILDWETKPKHALDEVQKLYGKLLHACHVLPSGRAYLTSLESFMAQFHNRPFCPHSPPCRTASDLQWWKSRLVQPTLARSIPGPTPIIDANTYSDASSETGIGITVGDRWRAWRLLPGWKADGRDIGWVEAIGFLLLTLTLSPTAPRGSHIKVFRDNRGVVEGWCKSRSRNKPMNDIFRAVHSLTEEEGILFLTRYVPSKENPADNPLRGIYYHQSLLLPAVPIPPPIRQYLCNYDAPLTASESCLIQEGRAPAPLPRPDRALLHQHRADLDDAFEHHARDAFSHTRGWDEV